MIAFIFVLVVFLPSGTAIAEWPGLPPDCWSDSRNVHSIADYHNQRDSQIKISRKEIPKAPAGVLSPNKGYSFFLNPVSRPSGTIQIYNEKKHTIDITFSDIQGLSDVRWINEKLIFIRVWWGRIAASDMIYDVEREAFIYVEDLTDCYITRQQYLENCPREGCQCIKKQ